MDGKPHSSANFHKLEPQNSSFIQEKSSSFNPDNTTNNEVNEFEKETSQLWLLRQLKTYLNETNVDDDVISKFVFEQDITAFRNFMTMDQTIRQALFVVVKRSTIVIEDEFDTIFTTNLANLNREQNSKRMYKINETKVSVEEIAKGNKNSVKPIPTRLKPSTTQKSKPQENKVNQKQSKIELKKDRQSVEEKIANKQKKIKKNKAEEKAETKDDNSLANPDLKHDTNAETSNLSTAEESENEKAERKKNRQKRKIMKKRKQKKESKEDIAQQQKNLLKSREESNKEILKELVQQEFSANSIFEPAKKTETSITLKWSDKQEIPEDSTEFVYILTRGTIDEKIDSKKSEFDKSYFVQYCRDTATFVEGIKLVKTIVGPDISFDRQINLLINFQTPIGTTQIVKWEDQEFGFENFICDTLMKGFKVQKLSFGSTPMEEASVDFVKNLLRPRIYAYVREPNEASRIQLLLELTLYELKLVGMELFSINVINFFQRALTIFSIMNIFYSQTNKEWIRKALFYCIEMTSRVLASNLQQRLWNLLGEDCLKSVDRNVSKLSDDEHHAICIGVRPILMQFIELGSLCMEHNSEEFHCLDKIKQCLKIMDFIEEDFDKLKVVVNDLCDHRRDMTFDRTKLDESVEIVQQIWNTFEESFFESSLESGNFEAMKNIYLQLSEHSLKLNNTIPPLDEYCISN